MKKTTLGFPWLVLLMAAAASVAGCQQDTREQKDTTPVEIDGDDIAGTVSSANGAEAGVWVIAESDDFDARFARIVSTDDAGRYLVPDLPAARYKVWVRGYGLTDSNKIDAAPGSIVDHTVQAAPDAAAAAQGYPAAYWYSMMKLPTEEETAHLPGGGGRKEYIMWMKNMTCIGCHQLGQLSTRTFHPSFGETENSEHAWIQRVSAGQAGEYMINVIAQELGSVPIKYLAEWTDRIAAGKLPHSIPERPQGLERNVVVTVRDWATPKHYMHDLSGTDRRNPTVNGYGRLYGAPEFSTDYFPIVDPVKNSATNFHAPVRDADTPTTHDMAVLLPSPYWGEERIWDSKANAHNPMLDQDGRVWFTARVRGPDNPDFCKEGSDHPSAKLFPLQRSGRHLSYYLPDSGEYVFVDTCFGTHHLQFAEDEDNTLWVSDPGGEAVGWLKSKQFLETGDAAASQGWAPVILDTNGNGKQDEWVEPDAPVDPNKDKRIVSGYYAIMINPADGSIWGSSAFTYPGYLIRLELGPNPPYTTLGEYYRVPLPGFGVRGADIDRNGVVWVSLGSGHLGEFDRSKCEGPLNGPEATGDHCPEGWTFHDLPGPEFPDEPGFSVESSYYTWVDQHNTLGLGANVPIVTGNLLDGVHAFVDGKFITLRVPYPLGFFTKGFEGRIDDPDAGWKGRGIWVPSGDRTPWLMEGGKGTKPLVVHFQVRPDPLAR